MYEPFYEKAYLCNRQCCGSGFGSEWICNKLKGRIRIRINLQMTSQNVWNMSLFEHFLRGWNLHLEARIRIRICIIVTSRIRIRIRIKGTRQDLDTDPHQGDSDLQHLALGKFKITPDRHNAIQNLNYCLLPDPPLFSLPSTFKGIKIHAHKQILRKERKETRK
jgi:hypothetical protein